MVGDRRFERQFDGLADDRGELWMRKGKIRQESRKGKLAWENQALAAGELRSLWKTEEEKEVGHFVANWGVGEKNRIVTNEKNQARRKGCQLGGNKRTSLGGGRR